MKSKNWPCRGLRKSPSNPSPPPAIAHPLIPRYHLPSQPGLDGGREAAVSRSCQASLAEIRPGFFFAGAMLAENAVMKAAEAEVEMSCSVASVGDDFVADLRGFRDRVMASMRCGCGDDGSMATDDSI